MMSLYSPPLPVVGTSSLTVGAPFGLMTEDDVAGPRGGGGGRGGFRSGMGRGGGFRAFSPGFGTRMLNRNVFIGPQPQNIGPGQRLLSYGPGGGGGRGGRWWPGRRWWGGGGWWGYPWYGYSTWGWPYYWSYPYYGYSTAPATPAEVFGGQPSMEQAHQYCQNIYWPYCTGANAGTSYCRTWAPWCLAVSAQ